MAPKVIGGEWRSLLLILVYSSLQGSVDRSRIFREWGWRGREQLVEDQGLKDYAVVHYIILRGLFYHQAQSESQFLGMALVSTAASLVHLPESEINNLRNPF